MKIAVFKVEPLAEDTALAQERISTALEIYKQGESFENLIRDFSEDSGEFGWIKRTDTKFDTIYNAIAPLKVGEVAGPLRFREGFYLFQLTERTKDSIKVRDIYVAIRPSENTFAEAYRKAQEFQQSARKKDSKKQQRS